MLASSVGGFVELVYQMIPLVSTFESFPFVVGIGDNRLRMCRSFLVEVLGQMVCCFKLVGVIRSVVKVCGTVSWFFEGFCGEF